MKIEKSSLTFFEGISILSFALELKFFIELIDKRIFSFDESLFEKHLPSSFKEGKINLIADQEKAKGYIQGEEFEVQPDQWNILSLELDGLTYETFLSLRLAGKLPGELEEASIQFALTKSKVDTEPGVEIEGTVKEIFSDVLHLGLTKNLNSFNLNSIFIKLFSKITGASENKSIDSILLPWFNSLEIPFVKEDESYLFSVRVGPDHWNVEIRPSESKKTIHVFSYLSITDYSPTLEKLESEITIINDEMKFGELEIDRGTKTLLLRSELDSSILTTEANLNLALEPIFGTMNAVILALKESHPNEQVFPSE
jgi:hypothetical protein